jgi:hypothetical protein
MSGVHRSFGRVAAAILAAALFATGLSPAGAQPSAKAEMRWFRGNTHTHSFNSDGDSPPATVAAWYREHGYQFLFFTDHDYVTDVDILNRLVGANDQFLILPGEEVTQWSDDPTRKSSRLDALIGAPAHVNALFVAGMIEPIGIRPCRDRACGRNSPSTMPIGETLKENAEHIQAAGAIAQLNHPNLLWALQPEDFDGVPDNVLLEIHNPAGNNLGGDDGEGETSASAEAIWDRMLSRGKIVWGVAVDDSHEFKKPDYGQAVESPGYGWIVVRAAELTAPALKASIKRGDFYASSGVSIQDISYSGTILSITMDPPSGPLTSNAPRFSTAFIGKDGRLLDRVKGPKPSYRIRGDEAYVRAVITDSSGRQAWTQPVFIDRRKARSPYQAGAAGAP